jgi:hypothetical protein
MISGLEALDDSKDVIGVGAGSTYVFVVLQDHVSEHGFTIWSAPRG